MRATKLPPRLELLTPGCARGRPVMAPDAEAPRDSRRTGRRSTRPHGPARSCSRCPGAGALVTDPSRGVQRRHTAWSPAGRSALRFRSRLLPRSTRELNRLLRMPTKPGGGRSGCGARWGPGQSVNMTGGPRACPPTSSTPASHSPSPDGRRDDHGATASTARQRRVV